MLHDLFNAFEETLFMVFASGLLTLLLGLPLGILLAITQPKYSLQNTVLYKSLVTLLNTAHSIPYLILMIILIPLTRLLMGTTEGCIAAILPLTLAATPFFARHCEEAIRSIPEGLTEIAHSLGASRFQVIRFVFIPEAQSKIIQGLTLALIHLLGYSAIAGALGAGGLGGLAIHKSYPTFQSSYLLATVFLFIALFQAIQILGEYIAHGRLK